MLNSFSFFRLHNVFFASILAAIVVVVSGCGGEEEHDGKKTIRIAHWWGDSEDVWREAIAEFEKTHPDIHVEQQVLSFNVHMQRVMTGTAAGADIGDLILMEDWFAQELLEREFLLDLQPYVSRDLGDDEIFPIALETFRNGGKLKAFPIALGSSPLFYNKDVFDAAGIAYPDTTWTYDTLVAAAAKLTKDMDGDGKPDQWGFLMDNNTGFDAALYSMGGAVLTDDLQKSAFAEPRTVQALQFWADLVLKYKVSPPSSTVMGGTSAGGSMRPFETGKFAMGMMSSFLTTYRNAQFRWDIALPPIGPAGRKALRFAAAFGIPNSSKHPEAAWEFLRWIVEEMPASYTDRMFFGLVPNSRRLAGSSEYLNGEPKVNRAVLIDLVENYSFAYWRTKWSEFRDQGFLPEVDQMVAGDKTVQQAAVDGDKRINEVIGGAKAAR